MFLFRFHWSMITYKILTQSIKSFLFEQWIFCTLFKTQKMLNGALPKKSFRVQWTMPILIFIFHKIAFFEHRKNHQKKIGNCKNYQFAQSAKGILKYISRVSHRKNEFNVLKSEILQNQSISDCLFSIWIATIS